MDYRKIALIFMLVELVTALTKYGVYTWPFKMLFGDAYVDWSAVQILVTTNQIMFLLLPFMAVVLFLKKSKFAYLYAALFPLSAFIFGIVPIPFANYLYSSNVHINSIFIAIVDLGAVYLVWWLYKKEPVLTTHSTRPPASAGEF